MGSALAAALHDKGLFVSGLFNRTRTAADRLGGYADAEMTGRFPESLEYLGQICFICVPDDSIEDVAVKLSALEGDFSRVSFVHTSGSKPASVLSPLRAKGSPTASFHPLQTFSGSVRNTIFSGCYISLQGDGPLIVELRVIADILDAHSLEVNEEQKNGLHLAAVFTCNYLPALMEAARLSLQSTGPDIDVVKVMGPLISNTWKNITQKGIDASLTGPVSRGDSGTVSRHLRGIKGSGRLTSIYTNLGSVTLDIARRRGLDAEQALKIQRVLDEAHGRI